MTRNPQRPSPGTGAEPRRQSVLATGAKGVVVVLGVAGSLVGVVSLLLVFFPVLKPCFGRTHASFTKIDVVRRVTQRDYLLRRGEPIVDLTQDELNTVGAEVRFIFETDGFRGKDLPIAWSLYFVDAGGERGRVVPGQDKLLALTAKSEDCSDQGSFDLFVIPPDTKRRYLVLLEIFRDKDLHNRLSFLGSKSFHG